MSDNVDGYKVFNLSEIKNGTLEEVAKYIAGFVGALAGYYLGKKVYTKIFGESKDVEEFAKVLVESKEEFDADPKKKEMLASFVENDTLQDLEQIELIFGKKLL